MRNNDGFPSPLHDDEVLPGGKIGIDIASKGLLFADKGFTSLTGFTQAELEDAGKGWASSFMSKHTEIELKHELTQLESTNRISALVKLNCKDKAEIWADVYAAITENEKYGTYCTLYFIDNTRRGTELKNAENTRREIEALWTTMPGGVAKVKINTDFNILFASDGFYKLTGYTREEYHSSPVYGKGSRLVLMEDREKLYNKIIKQMNSGEQFFAEYRLVKKDGEIVWIEAHGTPIYIQNGEPVAQVIFTDTTAVKNGTRQLISLTNSIPGGLVRLKLVKDKLSVEYASKGFYKLLGYSREKFNELGLNYGCEGIFVAKDRLRLTQELKAFFKSGETDWKHECRITDSTGKIIWINISARMHDDSAENNVLECVLTDITEMQKSREALRKSEMRYRFISEQMNEIVFEWDVKSGGIINSNIFEKRFGYALGEQYEFELLLTGKLLHPHDCGRFKIVIEKMKQGEEYAEAEIRIKHLDGRFLWSGLKLVSIFNDDGKPDKVMGILSDIESFKRKTDELSQLAERDSLTHTFNKAVTRERVIHSLKMHSLKSSALFILDIDKFKEVNDTYGHAMGDAALITLARRITRLVRENDIIGRIGGDEFLVYIDDGMTKQAAKDRANSFIDAMMNKPVEYNGTICHANISVGYALSPENSSVYDELFELADKALYTAKLNGRNQAKHCAEQSD